MKKMLFLFLVLLMGAVATSAYAIDIASLDRVSVLMSKTKVLSTLGAPDKTARIARGLNVEIYRVKDAMPLVRAGCIYNDSGILVGQSFVFEGSITKAAEERLRKIGFSLIDQRDGTLRLIGKDDDTDHMLITTFNESEGLSTITTFEKGFYERFVK